MARRSSVRLLLALLVVASAATAATTATASTAGTAGTAGAWRPELLPRQRETAAALAAAPPALAAEAGVYLLTERGFELARPSRNGFHCLVERDWPGAFEPQCFDEEGSATLLRGVLMAAELRMAGASRGEIAAALAAAYADGRLRAPRRPGINYMLSPENRVPVDDAGTILPYRPHLMFYVPYLTNRDLGSAGPGDPVFVINEGEPGAYAIVPVPAEAGEATPHEH